MATNIPSNFLDYCMEAPPHAHGVPAATGSKQAVPIQRCMAMQLRGNADYNYQHNIVAIS